jgi:hypothetical protein
MAELKTQPHDGSVTDFIASVSDLQRRADCETVLNLMAEITGKEPRMWGPSMVGFGSYRYRYKSGREGEWFVAGFSPRKQALTIYIMSGFSKYDDLMSRLGTYKTGKSCLYIKQLSDVDLDVLRALISQSVAQMSGASN